MSAKVFERVMLAVIVSGVAVQLGAMVLFAIAQHS